MLDTTRGFLEDVRLLTEVIEGLTAVQRHANDAIEQSRGGNEAEDRHSMLSDHLSNLGNIATSMLINQSLRLSDNEKE